MSRRLAVLACKKAIRSALQPRLQQAFESQQADVRESSEYRLWSAAGRASQMRMWRVLAAQIDADYPRIQSAARTASAGSTAETGDCKVPDYQTQTAIHGQPGGYMLERSDDDLAAGVLYEAGGNLYALGQGIGKKDSKGERLIALIRERYPTFQPARILELGCSAGGQSADYPVAFPEARVVAVDLSPAMLRYAHARSALLGASPRFVQADAGALPFPDGHFDLIVSHNLFHETAAGHMPAVARECYRVLAAGGVCLHQDVPIQTGRLDPFTRFVSEWQRDHNDEPFWMDFANADLPGLMVDAGFAQADVSAEYIRALDAPIPWYLVSATKP